MLSMMLVLILAAPAKTWESGHLISITRQSQMVGTGGVAIPIGTTTMITRGHREIVDYSLDIAVTINNAPFVITALDFDPKHSPNVIENDTIQYRISGHDLFILDQDKKELKLRIVKTRKP